jgi:hypothetical protein
MRVCLCSSCPCYPAFKAHFLKQHCSFTRGCLAVPYVFIFSHNLHDFRAGREGGVMENKICVWIFSTNFDRNISHSKDNLSRFHQIVHNY